MELNRRLTELEERHHQLAIAFFKFVRALMMSDQFDAEDVKRILNEAMPDHYDEKGNLR